MKKKYVPVFLLALSLMISVASAAYIIHYQLTVRNSMRLVVDNEFVIRTPNGTDVTEINWGDFYKGQTKSQNFILHYIGSSPGYVSWEHTFSDAWTNDWIVSIGRYTGSSWTGIPSYWQMSTMTPELTPGQDLYIVIWLTERDATPSVAYSEYLYFFGNTIV